MSQFRIFANMRRIFYFAFCAVISIWLTGCSDEEDFMTDISPISIVFDMVDGNGNSLLNSSKPGGLCGKDMILEHNGSSFEVSNWDGHWHPGYPLSGSTASRVCAPLYEKFFVLHERYEHIGNNSFEGKGARFLCYGQLSGDNNYNDDITITIPETGKTAIIHLYYKVKIKKNGLVESITKRFMVNGKDADIKTFKFGKYNVEVLQIYI